MSLAKERGVSFVVPVRNGAPWIRDVVAAIWQQADGRSMEVIVVDDGSDDGSDRILQELTGMGPLRILVGPGRGAAAAVNTGVRAARFPIICQVDQDVIVGTGWMARLAAGFDDPQVAAVQAYYASDPGASIFARTMALDLEQRYGAFSTRGTDHVCTGNSAYRAEALHRVGLFDERLGYGYDNDMSYRLRDRGYELLFCREARSIHRWREGLPAYCTQQYGFGYGRLDVVAKHPGRVAGDTVSPPLMMLHPTATACAVLGLIAAALLAAGGGPWRAPAAAAVALLAVLAIERAIAGVRAWHRFHDCAALLFPVLHLIRDLIWVVAIGVWLNRQMRGRHGQPGYSMRPRPAPHGRDLRLVPGAVPEVVGPVRGGPGDPTSALLTPIRVLALIPAYNEASNLAAVVAELRLCCPALDILVIDDGSTDDTATVLEALGAQWLRFPERMGIGSAIRAGLRYASRVGYETVVRLDGDGQHRASDIDRLIAPLCERRADVVLGSRYIEDPGPAEDGHSNFPQVSTSARREPGSERLPLRVLAGCLSALIGKPVTDPTSGFCAFGPRAVRLLAEHHPTGYPEPELQLFLNRNRLRVMEVPVYARPRLGGKTSLTPVRVIGLAARVLLALVIEPLRPVVRTPR